MPESVTVMVWAALVVPSERGDLVEQAAIGRGALDLRETLHADAVVEGHWPAHHPRIQHITHAGACRLNLPGGRRRILRKAAPATWAYPIRIGTNASSVGDAEARRIVSIRPGNRASRSARRSLVSFRFPSSRW